MAIPKKYEHIDFKPPESVANEAATGLEWRKKNKGRGGLNSAQSKKEGVGSGVQRAVNLKNRDVLSPATVKRMKAFFDRHEKSKDVPKGKSPREDKGAIAWKLWGGNSGRSWANKVCKQMEAADKKEKRAQEYIGGALVKNSSDEVDYMAVQNMNKVCDQAEEIKHVLGELVHNGVKLEDWLEDKMSKISDDMEEVYSYLIYGDRIKDNLSGGLADSKTEGDFDKDQLHEGMLVELEHTKNLEIAKEIAMDHLTEDPKYYLKLKGIEEA
jgi:hypothetical protein